MISKELFSEVLDNNVTDVDFDYDNEVLVIYNDGFVIDCEKFNIYELAHKCKEWASKNSDVIASYYYSNKWNANLWWNKERDLNGSDILFQADTEPEAIFKACEWIKERLG